MVSIALTSHYPAHSFCAASWLSPGVLRTALTLKGWRIESIKKNFFFEKHEICLTLFALGVESGATRWVQTYQKFCLNSPWEKQIIVDQNRAILSWAGIFFRKCVFWPFFDFIKPSSLMRFGMPLKPIKGPKWVWNLVKIWWEDISAKFEQNRSSSLCHFLWKPGRFSRNLAFEN